MHRNTARYAVIFIFRREDGSELVPQQVIELSRDYVSPPTDATGTTTEREILATELRREMSASIIRRIDSVVRAELDKGQPVRAEAEADRGCGAGRAGRRRQAPSGSDDGTASGAAGQPGR